MTSSNLLVVPWSVRPSAKSVPAAGRASGYVFMSYSWADQPYVSSLAALLTRAGVPVWYDHHAVVVGDSFATSIQSAIDGCAAVVVVLSATSVASRWVRREISYADSLGKPFVPLRITPCVTPITLSDLRVEETTRSALPDLPFVGRLRTMLAR